MKRIHFPYPLLILLIGIIWLFLIGENSDLVYELVLFLAFLFVWFINTSIEDTPLGDEWEEWGDMVNSYWFGKQTVDADRMHRMNYRIWENRMHVDRHYRNKMIVAGLVVLIIGTGILVWLAENVILWRAIVIISLSASGLVAVLVDEIIQRKRNNTRLK
jgi:hypothetical protein